MEYRLRHRDPSENTNNVIVDDALNDAADGAGGAESDALSLMAKKGGKAAPKPNAPGMNANHRGDWGMMTMRRLRQVRRRALPLLLLGLIDLPVDAVDGKVVVWKAGHRGRPRGARRVRRESFGLEEVKYPRPAPG